MEQISYLKVNSLVFIKKPFEDIWERPSKPVPSIEKPPMLELNTLLSHLKYAFLREDLTLVVIVPTTLTLDEKEDC